MMQRRQKARRVVSLEETMREVRSGIGLCHVTHSTTRYHKNHEFHVDMQKIWHSFLNFLVRPCLFCGS